MKMNAINLCSLSRLQKKKKNISAFEGLKQKEGKSAVAWWCGRGGFGAMEILPQHAASRRRGHQSFLCWEEARGRQQQLRTSPAAEAPTCPRGACPACCLTWNVHSMTMSLQTIFVEWFNDIRLQASEATSSAS